MVHSEEHQAASKPLPAFCATTVTTKRDAGSCYAIVHQDDERAAL
eukprot:CAMPEP_0171112002 /NCGR_PEP_ID=MMETSP0766_2-20121228/77584_1 /TAXON_ID=439317 /ORGANISM="Gambierdiscus australes, Strain CAWD 149" /LENGTH=44 /DNA_ID= /DNA_START= /DNA_END= /DNA_ORIENTATION=